MIVVIWFGLHALEEMEASDDVSLMIKKIMMKLQSSKEEIKTKLFFSIASLIIMKSATDVINGMLATLFIMIQKYSS